MDSMKFYNGSRGTCAGIILCVCPANGTHWLGTHTKWSLQFSVIECSRIDIFFHLYTRHCWPLHHCNQCDTLFWLWCCDFYVVKLLFLAAASSSIGGFVCLCVCVSVTPFYPRPVLAIGYCRCLRLCVSMCVSVCVSITSQVQNQSW